jgi:serine/threonine protein kinase
VGVVDEVKMAGITFARKTIGLRSSNGKSRLPQIQQEIRSIKALLHPHIISIIGDYQESYSGSRQFYCLLMHPVGDEDLNAFFDREASRLTSGQSVSIVTSAWIQKWFKCLSSALAHIHSRGVRHQDIKPSNVIRRGSDVLLTDFSSSGEFELSHTTSTENPAPCTRMYAAPERLADIELLERHGTRSDVFSLGCLFAEMMTVLSSRSVGEFRLFCKAGQDHPGSQLFYASALDEVTMWLQDVFLNRRKSSLRSDVGVFNLVESMLHMDRQKRPSAEEVLEAFRKVVGQEKHGTKVKLLQQSFEKGRIDVESTDSNGQTPLSWAAQNGHETGVKRLLAAGTVDVDFKDTLGRTSLSKAAGNGHKAVVQLLLATGKVEVDSKDNLGRTPLSKAAGNGHTAVVQLLLATRKVKVDSKDNLGRTPLSKAAGNGHQPVFKLLMKTGKVDVNSRGSKDWISFAEK